MSLTCEQFGAVVGVSEFSLSGVWRFSLDLCNPGTCPGGKGSGSWDNDCHRVAQLNPSGAATQFGHPQEFRASGRARFEVFRRIQSRKSKKLYGPQTLELAFNGTPNR